MLYVYCVYLYIYLCVLCCMCSYDYFHIFGSIECENKLQITTSLCRRMFKSSSSQLPFPVLLWVVPMSSSLWLGHYSLTPSRVLCVHIISTCCPFSLKLSVLPTFFLWWLHFLLLLVRRSMQLFSKNPFLHFTVSPWTLNPVLL